MLALNIVKGKKICFRFVLSNFVVNFVVKGPAVTKLVTQVAVEIFLLFYQIKRLEENVGIIILPDKFSIV